MAAKRSKRGTSLEPDGEPPPKKLRSADEEERRASVMSPGWSNKLGKLNGLRGSRSIEKPAELFRKDLISAMKLPDTEPLQPDDYFLIQDPWRQEWEKGVQVPVNPANIPIETVRAVEGNELLYGPYPFKMAKKLLHSAKDETYQLAIHELHEQQKLAEQVCRYDLDDLDVLWLEGFNELLDNWGEEPVTEYTMERAIEEIEAQCHEEMKVKIKTVEGLGIEYDENVVCDVCRSPDSEDGNEMVFCDNCDICVHQACYGVQTIPEGSWLCRPCALGLRPQCILCPKSGGAMKSTKSGSKWAHVSCALWIPEVSIGCAEKMEPITKISQIPSSRWSLCCSICRERSGACIQCSVKTCKTALHVTCAFQNNLEMRTILEDDNSEIQLKAYCQKHTRKIRNEGGLSPRKSDHGSPLSSPKKPEDMTEEEKTELRSHRLKKLEEEFYTCVEPEKVAKALEISEDVADFLYNYWVLKRKSNFNKPLLTPKQEEEDLLLKQQEDSLLARMKMFVHLRQDLERVRNLCYMVIKREKWSRSLQNIKEEIFWKQVTLLESEQQKSFGTRELSFVSTAHKAAELYDSHSDILRIARLVDPEVMPDPIKHDLEHIKVRPGRPRKESTLVGIEDKTTQDDDEDYKPELTDSEADRNVKEQENVRPEAGDAQQQKCEKPAKRPVGRPPVKRTPGDRSSADRLPSEIPRKIGRPRKFPTDVLKPKQPGGGGKVENTAGYMRRGTVTETIDTQKQDEVTSEHNSLKQRTVGAEAGTDETSNTAEGTVDLSAAPHVTGSDSDTLDGFGKEKPKISRRRQSSVATETMNSSMLQTSGDETTESMGETVERPTRVLRRRTASHLETKSEEEVDVVSPNDTESDFDSKDIKELSACARHKLKVKDHHRRSLLREMSSEKSDTESPPARTLRSRVSPEAKPAPVPAAVSSPSHTVTDKKPKVTQSLPVKLEIKVEQETSKMATMNGCASISDMEDEHGAGRRTRASEKKTNQVEKHSPKSGDTAPNVDSSATNSTVSSPVAKEKLHPPESISVDMRRLRTRNSLSSSKHDSNKRRVSNLFPASQLVVGEAMKERVQNRLFQANRARSPVNNLHQYAQKKITSFFNKNDSSGLSQQATTPRSKDCQRKFGGDVTPSRQEQLRRRTVRAVVLSPRSSRASSSADRLTPSKHSAPSTKQSTPERRSSRRLRNDSDLESDASNIYEPGDGEISIRSSRSTTPDRASRREMDFSNSIRQHLDKRLRSGRSRHSVTHSELSEDSIDIMDSEDDVTMDTASDHSGYSLRNTRSKTADHSDLDSESSTGRYSSRRSDHWRQRTLGSPRHLGSPRS